MKILRTMAGRPWKALMLLLALTLIWVPVGWAGSATEDLKSLIDEVQGILRHEAPGPQRLGHIEQVTARHLDFRKMSGLCLGSTWDGLNRGQQDEFVRLFSKLLQASYSRHLDDFAKDKVVYQGDPAAASESEVHILIVRPNDRIPVTFRLLQESQGWMIYDLVIEEVSMVSNFQTQFARVIHSSSYQGLLHRLKLQVEGER